MVKGNSPIISLSTWFVHDLMNRPSSIKFSNTKRKEKAFPTLFDQIATTNYKVTYV
jgi:hypothetical protein